MKTAKILIFKIYKFEKYFNKQYFKMIGVRETQWIHSTTILGRRYRYEKCNRY